MNKNTNRRSKPHDAHIVQRAFALHQSMSYGKVAKQLSAEFNVPVGKTTVSQWINGIARASETPILIDSHKPYTPTPATHCKRGHEFERGSDGCRVCRRMRKRAYRQGKKIH